MKKALYGTTALATAALVAAGAGDAFAQEHGGGRIQIEVHGYMQQWLVGVDQDFNDGGNPNRFPDERGYTVNRGWKAFNVDQKTNAEVCFVGQTTLDNGITVGVNVQLEAFREQSGAHIDESFLFLQSDRFGRLQVGAKDGAASLLTVNAPDGGISVDDDGDVTTLSMFQQGVAFNTALNSTVVTTEADFGADSNAFTYITPRLYGFQAGISYIPTAGEVNNPGGNPPVAGVGTQYNSGVSAGLNYSNVFANGFGVRMSTGILSWNQTCGNGGPAGGTAIDPDQDCNQLLDWRVGGQLSYAGFTVGGGYKQAYGNLSNGLGEGNPSLLRNGQAWSAGATYETGPYTVGVTYVQGSAVGWNIPGTGDVKSKIGTIAGTYVLGPGIRLRGGFFMFDQDAEVVPDAGATAASIAANAAAIGANVQNTSDTSGWGGALGITASF
jgi:outer membrane protein OmpU